MKEQVMDEEPRTCPQIRRLLAARGPGRGLRRVSVAMSHGETPLAYGGSCVPPPLRAQPRLGTRWGGLFCSFGRFFGDRDGGVSVGRQFQDMQDHEGYTLVRKQLLAAKS